MNTADEGHFPFVPFIHVLVNSERHHRIYCEFYDQFRHCASNCRLTQEFQVVSRMFHSVDEDFCLKTKNFTESKCQASLSTNVTDLLLTCSIPALGMSKMSRQFPLEFYGGTENERAVSWIDCVCRVVQCFMDGIANIVSPLC